LSPPSYGDSHLRAVPSRGSLQTLRLAARKPPAWDSQRRRRASGAAPSPLGTNGHKRSRGGRSRVSLGNKNPLERGFSEAAGQGFEPQLPDPESGVLPLDDPATGRGPV